MTDIQGKVFNDFIPPATTDGSYRGKKEQRDATQKHFRMKLKQELATINQRLEQCKIKVKLLLTGNAIQLQATLPLKPGDTHKQGRSNKQYKISLGIPANFDGLRTAEEEAQELGKLIARQTFIWTDKYLGVRATKEKGITFREFYNIFELKYFANKKKTRKSIGTFENYKSRYKSIFMSDKVISAKSLREIVLSIYSPTPRYEAIRIASIISNLLSIDTKFTDLILQQEKRERSIPNDKEIVFHIGNFQKQYESAKNIPKSIKHKWKIYKLAYGLLAIYGLRPREIINKPDFNWLLSSDNIRNTFKVHSDNKTGYREVVPFVPEWVDLFNIKNEENTWQTEALKTVVESLRIQNTQSRLVRSVFFEYFVAYLQVNVDSRAGMALAGGLQALAALLMLPKSMCNIFSPKTYKELDKIKDKVKQTGYIASDK